MYLLKYNLNGDGSSLLRLFKPFKAQRQMDHAISVSVRIFFILYIFGAEFFYCVMLFCIKGYPVDGICRGQRTAVFDVFNSIDIFQCL